MNPAKPVKKERRSVSADATPVAIIKPSRLASIDALRGFDMLMIAGGGTFIQLLGGKTDWVWLNALAAQFEHPDWLGFTFYDFIFPLFLFLAGVSLPFSLRSGLAKGLTKRDLLQKVFKRMLVLILLGILYKNAPVPFFDPANIRFGSVLGRIGIGTFVAAVLFLNFSTSQRLYIALGILVAYCAALLLIPVPGHGAGDLSFEGNLVGWFDRQFMPGRLLQKTYDELALLTQFPAACLVVFGTLAGDALLADKSAEAKIKHLLAYGVAGVALGVLWNFFFPISKHLWSSSFIALTAGMAFLALTAFYWLIDVRGFQRWTFFLRVIGMNSLVMYLAYRFIDFDGTSRLLFSRLYGQLAENWHDVVNALGGLLVAWLFLYFLYRQRVFVKV